MISSSPVTWTMRHVPGHQDGDSSVKLDWWATQNIQMDNLAKVFWMQHSHLAPVFYPISDEGFQVWLSNRKLSCHNTPPVSAEWETCSSSGKNSRPRTALAAESTRMLAMYGLAKNLLSSLSGRCLCHLSANGSSQFTPPKKSHIGSSSQRLTKWQSSEPFSHAHSDMPGLLQAIDAQDRIGWLAFFEGCIAVEWAGVQEAHFIWLG